MLRKPAFWVLLAALSFAAAAFTLANFSTAFPLVSLDIRMDRQTALRTARALAEKNAWPPAGFDQAAEFSGDQEVQNFIELEGGGKTELGRIVKDKIFALYAWRVRHFKEADAHETLVRFTPEGEPYGFRITLPDQEPGESKAEVEAQQLAESTAQQDWKIDFTRYRLVESSKDVRPGGRTDHTFVYERQDEQLREGRYRLRLVVGGDKLTELTHFVQVPEGFSRRYEELRSANDAIGAAASIATFVLYILGFCGVGLFFMMRERWLVWKQAALWGIFIAFLMALDQLNSWPLIWMGYDTAVSSSGFAFRQIATALAIFAALAALLTVSFAAAETLSRRAFPHHIQLWRAWSRPVSASKPLLGQTIAGYLLVAPFFAYEIVLYFFAQERLGWWTPSDSLVNPDVFAKYLPSLSAIAQSAQAGFWEECLFRAVPLATAALIGDRFGKRRLFIIAAMILQAVIFGAGHAGYANQPAYARVVELMIPSFAFGALYLAFGLVPGVVLHYAYDVVWIALPIFVSAGGRARVEQAIVVLLALVPLWVVIAGRMRAGKSVEISDDALNAAWKPFETVGAVYDRPGAHRAPLQSEISVTVMKFLPVAGVIGLVLWAASSRFQTDAPPIEITRSEAETAARDALSQRGFQLDPAWTVMSRVEGQPGEQHRFVWQKARDRYDDLVGSYLTPPHWRVRFARFEGDVAERAEEYRVVIDGAGRIQRVTHVLPESRAGKNLTMDEARAIVPSSLKDGSSFTEISAEAGKRPARTDWIFVFKDIRNYGLPEGEPRVSVEIAGDEVVDTARYIYVPEEWSRNERRQRNLPAIFTTACTIALIGIALAGAVLAAVYWSRKRAFSVRTFLLMFVVLFGLSAVNVLNSWPIIKSQLLTSQPLVIQAAVIIAVGLMVAVFTASALALIAGLIAVAPEMSARMPLSKILWIGISIGAFLAGIAAIARQAGASTSPLWGNLGPASAWLPIVTAALSPLSAYLTQTLILIVVLFVIARKPGWTALLILVGLLLAGASIETIPLWLITGIAIGTVLLLAYRFVLVHEPRLIVPTVGTMLILSTIRDGFQQAHPSALVGSLAASILILAAAYICLRSGQNAGLSPRLQTRM